ncbi:MAG: hypothetical protein ACOC24_07000, partial [Desulfovibrionales bacterium]
TATLWGIGVVMLNIERIDLRYEFKEIADRLDRSEDLRGKLEVERDNLTSSSSLKRAAGKGGFTQAGPGQIRRIYSVDHNMEQERP